MKLKFLGTGTSQGVPAIGCKCRVCRSENPKDKRLRSSAILTTESGKKILIDCGPDFRQQMLTNDEDNVDAVLITHEHNDHIIGLDDLRPIIFRHGNHMSLYCKKRTGHEIKQRFPYAFADLKYPGAPSFNLIEIENNFKLFDCEVEPFEVMHYKIPILGFKFKNLAYITDASFLSDTVIKNLKNIDYLILNCLRKEDPHPAHFILPQVLEIFKKIAPKNMYLTHISHHLGLHDLVQEELPALVNLAFDGLEINF